MENWQFANMFSEIVWKNVPSSRLKKSFLWKRVGFSAWSNLPDKDKLVNIIGRCDRLENHLVDAIIAHCWWFVCHHFQLICDAWIYGLSWNWGHLIEIGCYGIIFSYLVFFQNQTQKYLQEPETRQRKQKIICACAEYHDFREHKASVKHHMRLQTDKCPIMSLLK